MTRAELVEIGAKAAREVWRDREAVRADTLDWEHIDRYERSACLAAQAAALAAIEAAGMAVVPKEATASMMNEGGAAIHVARPGEPCSVTAAEAYKVMIAASPVEARDE